MVKKRSSSGAINQKNETDIKNALKSLAYMLFGALVMAVLFLWFYGGLIFNKSTPKNAPSSETVHGATIPQKPTESKPKTEYEFYDVLPGRQFQALPDAKEIAPSAQTAPPKSTIDATVYVDTPDVPEADIFVESEAAPQEGTKSIYIAKAEPQSMYFLQIRSYTNPEEANLKRNEVAMAGVMDSRIIQKTQEDGTTIYTVISSFGSDKDAVLDAFALLQKSGIDALVVEQKPR